MKRTRFQPAPPRRFSSKSIVLLLGGALVTTGIVAGAFAEEDDPPEPVPNSQTPVVSQTVLAQDLQQDREEENNSYVPGLGYYHALHHSWFPYPFDYYYSGFGYYRGGAWFGSPYRGIAFPTRTKPHWNTVTDDRPLNARPSSGMRFTSSGSGFHGTSSQGGSISRGGFTAPHSSGFHAGGGHFSGS